MKWTASHFAHRQFVDVLFVFAKAVMEKRLAMLVHLGLSAALTDVALAPDTTLPIDILAADPSVPF